MRRKPSASHCVQKIPFERYRPSRAVLLAGAISVTTYDESRRFTLEDAELLEVMAGLAAATLVGHEEARLGGVLLSARTAQHEVNNRLSLVRGYGEIVADHPDLPEELKHPAHEIVRASRAAADILRKLNRPGQASRVENRAKIMGTKPPDKE